MHIKAVLMPNAIAFQMYVLAGLSELMSIQHLMALMRKSRQLQFSGMHPKDEHEMVVETLTSSNLKHIF